VARESSGRRGERIGAAGINGAAWKGMLSLPFLGFPGSLRSFAEGSVNSLAHISSSTSSLNLSLSIFIFDSGSMNSLTTCVKFHISKSSRLTSASSESNCRWILTTSGTCGRLCGAG
jgi:hypothetical protein